jgi:hypothetical protein
MKALTIDGIIKDGIALGIKNLPALLVNTLLWILTFWIPYLNVGTTIGLVGLIAKMGRNEGLSFTEIFNPEYRKNMGEFFLVASFVGLGVTIGYVFLIIPAVVIGIAWSQAVLLVIDKNYEPMAAIKKSNELTYGKKWIIFLAPFIIAVVLVIILAILYTVTHFISGILAGLIGVAGYVFIFAILAGVKAQIYKELTVGVK